jgi:hypothetical protein
MLASLIGLNVAIVALIGVFLLVASMNARSYDRRAVTGVQ